MNALRCSILCICVLLAILAISCSDSSVAPKESGGEATLRIVLTDEPTDLLDSAMVTISRVYLVPGGADSAFVDLLPDTDPPMTYDLLTLQDGVEAFLAEKPVPADSFAQLRLVVDEATVSLADGYMFRDGTTSSTLHVPSGQQSGIKVHLAEPIVVTGDSMLVVVVDFDVNDNFVIQGNPDAPAGIQGILFTPVLKEKGRRTEDEE
ncbi:DUF4382 domain-containing protein [Candidatus Eisenbacteria bacterium]|uniref:DUF4382 domain-containing protein n=1 Tax=Eiseniibacteriota bacterium TaxID=2212470 RepID=A0ABV6YJ51_UNCEI